MIKKTALITGGAKRVGKAIGFELARNGWRLAVHCNSSVTEAENFAEEVAAGGTECRIFRADLSLSDAPEALFNAVTASMGNIQLLINNASVFEQGSLAETTGTQLESMFRLNFFAPFALLRCFYRQGIAAQAINLLDTKTAANRSKFAAYTLSKKALHDLTLMAATEFAPLVRVNGIAPGLVLPPDNASAEQISKIISASPLRKASCIDELTATVRYFLQADSVTGQVIYLDGGTHLR